MASGFIKRFLKAWRVTKENVGKNDEQFDCKLAELTIRNPKRHAEEAVKVYNKLKELKSDMKFSELRESHCIEDAACRLYAENPTYRFMLDMLFDELQSGLTYGWNTAVSIEQIIFINGQIELVKRLLRCYKIKV